MRMWRRFVFWANALGLVFGLWLAMSIMVHASPKVHVWACWTYAPVYNPP